MLEKKKHIKNDKFFNDLRLLIYVISICISKTFLKLEFIRKKFFPILIYPSFVIPKTMVDKVLRNILNRKLLKSYVIIPINSTLFFDSYQNSLKDVREDGNILFFFYLIFCRSKWLPIVWIR